MKRIYLIDCPGVVYPAGDTETDLVLKGVVSRSCHVDLLCICASIVTPLPFQIRVEYLKTADEHIPTVLERVKADYIRNTYKVESWSDTNDFLEKVAKKSGKLLKVTRKTHSVVGVLLHESLNTFFREASPISQQSRK